MCINVYTVLICERDLGLSMSPCTFPRLFSSLQLATGTSCNKHSNWTVLSQSLHSFNSIMDTTTDSCGCFAWCIVVSTFLPFVLLSVANDVITLFCAATMLLSCCVATILYYMLLPCYVVVLGLYFCSIVLSLLSWCVFSPIFLFHLFLFWIPAPVPAGGLWPCGRPSL